MLGMERDRAKIRLDEIEEKIEELLIELKTHEENVSKCVEFLSQPVASDLSIDIVEDEANDGLGAVLDDCEENIERILEEIGDLKEEAAMLHDEYFYNRM